MCGISGMISLDRKVRPISIIENMTDVLFHRGPDMAGTCACCSSLVRMGQRRLSIIDLSENGRQPMKLESAGLTIVYNGEIFNYRDIREELKKRGHRFTTDTDT